jgi:sterol desaturase/sphingolipid hydroxylase (fatty acid hydroxylase superfamily)
MNIPGWVLVHQAVLQISGFYGILVFFTLWETLRPFSSHPPHRLGRWTVNYLLFFSFFLVHILRVFSSVEVSLWAAQEKIGLLNQVALPFLSVLTISMTVRSLGAWVLHILMHKTPFLWRIHRVHHLDTVMDVSTTVRFHPIELGLSLLVSIATVLLFGLPVWAIVIYEALEAAVRYFSHANIRLPGKWDWALRFVFSTPAMHRLHHSTSRVEADSNYGSIFSLWDHLFGTYTTPKGKNLAGMPLGTMGFEKSKVQSFLWLLASPFRRPSDGK